MLHRSAFIKLPVYAVVWLGVSVSCKSNISIIAGHTSKENNRCSDLDCKNSLTLPINEVSDETPEQIANSWNGQVNLVADDGEVEISGEGTEDLPFFLRFAQNAEQIKVKIVPAESDFDLELNCIDMPSWVRVGANSSSFELHGSYLGVSSTNFFSCEVTHTNISRIVYFATVIDKLTEFSISGTYTEEFLGERMLLVDLNRDGLKDVLFSYKTSSGGLGYRILWAKSNRDHASNTSVDESSDGDFTTITGADGFPAGLYVQDVNGDGFDDVVFSRSGTNCLGTSTHRVIYARSANWNAELDIFTELDGVVGSIFTVASGCQRLYFSDYDGDSIQDVFFGHYYETGVVFGTSSGWGSSVNLSTQKVSFANSLGGDHLGHSHGIGDLNGDGIPEIILSTYSPYRTFVLLGGSLIWGTVGSRPASIDMIDLAGNNGFFIDLAMSHNHTPHTHVVEDFNGDGIGDLALRGSFTVSTGGAAGGAFIFFGRNSEFQPSYNTLVADSLIKFEGHWSLNERGMGKTFYNAIDFNGDGIKDFCFEGTDYHKYYCFFGRPNWTATSYRTADLGSADGFKINAGSTNFLTAYGDLNKNGKTDFLMSDPSNDGGKVYLVYGRDFDFSAGYLNYSGLTSELGSTISSKSADQQLGKAVKVGDIDGDGNLDLIISSPGSNIEDKAAAGKIQVIFGTGTGFGSRQF